VRRHALIAATVTDITGGAQALPELDFARLWPMETTARWADMRRGNDLTTSGERMLRFPAFVARDEPGVVAAQIRAALRGGGVAVP